MAVGAGGNASNQAAVDVIRGFATGDLQPTWAHLGNVLRRQVPSPTSFLALFLFCFLLRRLSLFSASMPGYGLVRRFFSSSVFFLLQPVDCIACNHASDTRSFSCLSFRIPR